MNVLTIYWMLLVSTVAIYTLSWCDPLWLAHKTDSVVYFSQVGPFSREFFLAPWLTCCTAQARWALLASLSLYLVW